MLVVATLELVATCKGPRGIFRGPLRKYYRACEDPGAVLIGRLPGLEMNGIPKFVYSRADYPTLDYCYIVKYHAG
jgi:hypothetical protein